MILLKYWWTPLELLLFPSFVLNGDRDVVFFRVISYKILHEAYSLSCFLNELCVNRVYENGAR